MGRRTRGGLVAVVLCLGVGAPVRAQENAALCELAERYWDALLRQKPAWATALGEYSHNDKLEDLSEAGRQRWQHQLRGLQKDLYRIPERTLSESDALIHQLLQHALRDRLLRLELNKHLVPLDPLWGPHLRFPLILTSQPFRDARDFDAYVRRLRAFPQQVNDMIANMRRGSAAGVVSPRVIVERVLGQLRTHIVADATESVFYAPVRQLSQLAPAEREAVRHAVLDAIQGDVIPAYLQLLAYVEDDYLHRCRSTIGISALPRGEQLYAAHVYLSTSLRLTPAEIHAYGLTRIKEIESQLAALQPRLGFEGTVGQFLEHMRQDVRYRARSRAEILERYRGVLERTKPRIKELVTKVPRTDCVVMELEPFRAESAPAAYYNLAPHDGSSPAYFYVNTHAPSSRVTYTTEVLTYHESVPGHHLQMSLAQENESLPQFQRYARNSAFEEGWALYAEGLAREIDGYADPVQEFGRLSFALWRAARLVVDTGIHAQGWSRQQALDFMAQHTALTPAAIEAEVDRYIVWPGQALSYQLGLRVFLGLRDEAIRTLGARFDARTFHDELLSWGAQPLDILEQRMQAWIKAQP